MVQNRVEMGVRKMISKMLLTAGLIFPFVFPFINPFPELKDANLMTYSILASLNLFVGSIAAKLIGW